VERSLSVLLPVYNAQSSLATTVQEVIDVVSELTARFELVIIDDGSDDATSEVAYELTQHYPQVGAVFHGHKMGYKAAISSGFQRSNGEIIFLCDETSGQTLDATAKLWRTVGRQSLAAGAEAPAGHQQKCLGACHPLRRAGYHMVDRQTMEKRHGLSQPTRPNYLGKVKDFTPPTR